MKVRLKHQYEDIKKLLEEFQFHEGPIKALLRFAC